MAGSTDRPDAPLAATLANELLLLQMEMESLEHRRGVPPPPPLRATPPRAQHVQTSPEHRTIGTGVTPVRQVPQVTTVPGPAPGSPRRALYTSTGIAHSPTSPTPHRTSAPRQTEADPEVERAFQHLQSLVDGHPGDTAGGTDAAVPSALAAQAATAEHNLATARAENAALRATIRTMEADRESHRAASARAPPPLSQPALDAVREAGEAVHNARHALALLCASLLPDPAMVSGADAPEPQSALAALDVGPSPVPAPAVLSSDDFAGHCWRLHSEAAALHNGLEDVRRLAAARDTAMERYVARVGEEHTATTAALERRLLEADRHAGDAAAAHRTLLATLDASATRGAELEERLEATAGTQRELMRERALGEGLEEELHAARAAEAAAKAALEDEAAAHGRTAAELRALQAMQEAAALHPPPAPRPSASSPAPTPYTAARLRSAPHPGAAVQEAQDWGHTSADDSVLSAVFLARNGHSLGSGVGASGLGAGPGGGMSAIDAEVDTSFVRAALERTKPLAASPAQRLLAATTKPRAATPTASPPPSGYLFQPRQHAP